MKFHFKTQFDPHMCKYLFVYTHVYVCVCVCTCLHINKITVVYEQEKTT